MVAGAVAFDTSLAEGPDLQRCLPWTSADGESWLENLIPRLDRAKQSLIDSHSTYSLSPWLLTSVRRR